MLTKAPNEGHSIHTQTLKFSKLKFDSIFKNIKIYTSNLFFLQLVIRWSQLYIFHLQPTFFLKDFKSEPVKNCFENHKEVLAHIWALLNCPKFKCYYFDIVQRLATQDKE